MGIDAAKKIDIAVHASDQGWAFANNDRGIVEAVSCLKGQPTILAILKASGGIESPSVAALAVVGIAVAVAKPHQVRDFARAPCLAKTDAINAMVLALFAAAILPALRPFPKAEAQELSALLGRRSQLVKMMTAGVSRLRSARSKPVQNRI